MNEALLIVSHSYCDFISYLGFLIKKANYLGYL
jgi:hypothetical protein